jgi:hypothetical protein
VQSKRTSDKVPESLEISSGAAGTNTTASSGYSQRTWGTSGTRSVQGSTGSGGTATHQGGMPLLLLRASLVPQPPSPRSELQLLERRIAPASTGGAPSAYLTRTNPHFSVDALPATTDDPGKHARIAAELNALAALDHPLFAGKWHLMREQRHGGQAVVQFARDTDANQMQYAIKCAPTHMKSCAIKSAALTRAWRQWVVTMHVHFSVTRTQFEHQA